VSNKTLNLNDSLYNYMLSISLREPEILKLLRHETSHLTGAQMQISPEQGQFMALIIELLQARKTLEIGVYTGYSSLVVALALPADGKVIACDINNEAATMAKQYWQKASVAHKIDLHLIPGVALLEQLINKNEHESFDFIFIDADKDNYTNYYEKSLILLRQGGLLLIDNTLWSGKVADDSIIDNSTCAIRELNQKIHHDDRVTLSLLPVADGLTLARKR
jgi:predicted O-methyltransferase YrrM